MGRAEQAGFLGVGRGEGGYGAILCEICRFGSLACGFHDGFWKHFQMLVVLFCLADDEHILLGVTQKDGIIIFSSWQQI
jgi:hypothetical protein